MSIYNGEPFLHQSIESILDQTFRDFEFILINDGSTDRTIDILKQYARKDQRIRVVNNENNLGLTESLNKGIALSKGEFIARMDADDVSFENRFEKELKYLFHNPSVALVGSAAETIDNNGNVLQAARSKCTNDSLLKWKLLFGNQFVHSSVLVRKEAVNKAGGYDKQRIVTEDFDLWSRLSRYHKVANLPDTLVQYRDHQTQSTKVHADIEEADRLKVSTENLRHIGIFMSTQSLQIVHRVLRKSPEATPADIIKTAGLLPEIFSNFVKRSCFTGSALELVRGIAVEQVTRGLRNAGRIIRANPFNLLICLYWLRVWRLWRPNELKIFFRAVQQTLRKKRLCTARM